MGVRLAFNLGGGEWLELKRCDYKHFYAFLTNENVEICDQEIGLFGEKELGEALLKILDSLKKEN